MRVALHVEAERDHLEDKKKGKRRSEYRKVEALGTVGS